MHRIFCSRFSLTPPYPYLSMSNSKTGFDSKLYAKYASLKDPKEKLPRSIYYWHTERTLTVLEQFPKSKIHVIMIPRVGAPPRVPANMRNLYTWLTSSEVSKSDAQELLLDMRRDLDELLLKLKEEMEYSYEYVGNFWAGFKADPSYKCGCTVQSLMGSSDSKQVLAYARYV